MNNNTDVEQQRKAAIRNTFDMVAEGYGKGGCRFFHLSGEAMADLLPLRGDEHVLDIASGSGAAAIPLARRLTTGKVTAVDFSPGMLAQAEARARAEGLNNLDFQLHDMTALPYAEGQFDHANCAFGLFFVEDMSSLLAHIAAKVKPGGTVLISGFCGESFMPVGALAFDRLRAYGIDLPEQPLGWKRMAEPEQLNELFAAAGLKEVEIIRKSLGYYIDAEGWWDVMWNAGFRGLIAQLGDRLEEFRREHLAEVRSQQDDNGLWLEVDVNFTMAIKP